MFRITIAVCWLCMYGCRYASPYIGVYMYFDKVFNGILTYSLFKTSIHFEKLVLVPQTFSIYFPNIEKHKIFLFRFYHLNFVTLVVCVPFENKMK